MNTNPHIVIVSLGTGTIQARTRWDEFVRCNSNEGGISAAEFDTLFAALGSHGAAVFNGGSGGRHLLIDVSLTEHQVSEWLIAQRAALPYSESDLTVTVTRYFPDQARWLVEGNGQPFKSGSTLTEAVENFNASLKSNAQVATEKRAAAAKLLAEAATLEAEAA